MEFLISVIDLILYANREIFKNIDLFVQDKTNYI